MLDAILDHERFAILAIFVLAILAIFALSVVAFSRRAFTLQLSKSPDRFELELRAGTRPKPKRRKPRLPPPG